MSDEYFSRMKTLAFEAGKIALKFIDQSEPSFKADNSILTKADQAISSLSQEYLADIIKNPDHILIEEEDSRVAEYLDEVFLDKTPYIWTIDPIDGTRPYSNRIPAFSISIGLLKELKPWMGVVYFPALKELFYCDGKGAFFVQNAFESNEKKSAVVWVDQVVSSQAIFFCHDGYFERFNWDYQSCRIMMLGCAAVHLCWPTIGRGCGAIFRSYLWDFAACWPIISAAGMQLRALHTEKVLTQISEDLFDKKDAPWKMKDFYILSSEKNFPVLKGKISEQK